MVARKYFSFWIIYKLVRLVHCCNLKLRPDIISEWESAGESNREDVRFWEDGEIRVRVFKIASSPQWKGKPAFLCPHIQSHLVTS